MACTLDLYTDYLISSTDQTSATGLSRLFDGQLSHDQVRRWLSQVHLDSRQVWGHAKPLIRQTERALKANDFAVLVVDDSILEKAHTDANALLCTRYDHSPGRYVKGLNFVSLLYNGRRVLRAVCRGVGGENTGRHRCEHPESELQKPADKKRDAASHAAGHVAGHAARSPAGVAPVTSGLPLPAGRQLVRLGREYELVFCQLNCGANC